MSSLIFDDERERRAMREKIYKLGESAEYDDQGNYISIGLVICGAREIDYQINITKHGEHFTCTCPDFNNRKHAPNFKCKHLIYCIRAVFGFKTTRDIKALTHDAIWQGAETFYTNRIAQVAALQRERVQSKSSSSDVSSEIKLNEDGQVVGVKCEMKLREAMAQEAAAAQNEVVNIQRDLQWQERQRLRQKHLEAKLKREALLAEKKQKEKDAKENDADDVVIKGVGGLPIKYGTQQKPYLGEECAICFDEVTDRDRIWTCWEQCGKSVHFSCMSLWRKKNATCVFCRATLKYT